MQELCEELSTYGDVTVVKSAPCLYWVNYESYDNELNNQPPVILKENDSGKQVSYPIDQSQTSYARPSKSIAMRSEEMQPAMNAMKANNLKIRAKSIKVREATGDPTELLKVIKLFRESFKHKILDTKLYFDAVRFHADTSLPTRQNKTLHNTRL